jgi:hypothetical protein
MTAGSILSIWSGHNDRAGRNAQKLYLGNSSRYGRVLDDAVAEIKAKWRVLLAEFMEAVP